jgi:hypothetical protein
MRKLLLALAGTLALAGASAFSVDRAEAMALGTPAGIRTAIEHTNLAQDVRYVCWRRCGPRGCRRICEWRPGPRYYRPYGYYRPSRYGWRRPYYRPWRRW